MSIPLLTFDDLNRSTKSWLFGALALPEGVITLIQALPAGHSGNGKRWLTLAQGVVGIIIGLVVITLTRMVPGPLIAIWAIVTGILEISAAVRIRRSIPNEFIFLVAHGALSVALAMKFAVDPAGVRSLGIYALASGFTLIVAMLYRRRKETVEASRRR